MAYPTDLETFVRRTNKAGVTETSDTDRVYASVVNELQAAIERAMAHVGVAGSAVPGTIDYILRNAASVDPGHSHSAPTNLDLYNVADYGALGDGTTDDTGAIQDAIDAMPAEGATLYLPYGAAGLYAISDELLFKNQRFCTIQANYAQLAVRDGAAMNGKGMLNVTGSDYLRITGLRFDSRHGDTHPIAALIAGRTNDNSGGSQVFDGCILGGFYTLGTVYSASAEVQTFRNCLLQSEVASVPACFNTSTDDNHNLTNGVAASNTRQTFRDCALVNYATGSAAAVIVTLEGVQSEVAFRDCYAGTTVTGALTVIDCVPADGYSNDSVNQLFIENMRVEQTTPNAGTRLIDYRKANEGTGWRIGGLTWTVASDYIIKLRMHLSDAILDFGYGGSATDLIEILDGAAFHLNEVKGVLSLGGVGRIRVTSPSSESANILMTRANGGYPFKGTGSLSDTTNAQSDIVLAAAPEAAYAGIPLLRQRTKLLTANDATPDVSGYSHFRTQNTNDTLITIFDFGTAIVQPGHKLTLKVGDTHTIFQHSSVMRLRGAVNWSAPQNAEITFVYDDEGGGAFQEVGRADPSSGAFRNVSADFAATDLEETIFADSSPGQVTITLPSVVNRMGKEYKIRKTDASGNAVRVIPSGSETINGAGSGSPQSTTTRFDGWTFKSNGINGWVIIS